MEGNRQYDKAYKAEAVKLAKEIGQAKAAVELGVPKNTLYEWIRASRMGNLDLGVGAQPLENTRLPEAGNDDIRSIGGALT